MMGASRPTLGVNPGSETEAALVAGDGGGFTGGPLDAAVLDVAAGVVFDQPSLVFRRVIGHVLLSARGVNGSAPRARHGNQPGPCSETRQRSAIPTSRAWSSAATHAAAEVAPSALMRFSPV